MPDLPALEALLAVAHAGSLNAASRQLGMTQQAMSARITSAEARTGVALAARTPRESTLTPEGVVTAEWAAPCSRSRANSTPGWPHSAATSRHGCVSASA